MLETANLQDSLVSEQDKRSIAEARVSALTHDLQDVGAKLSAASLQVRKVCTALPSCCLDDSLPNLGVGKRPSVL